MAWKNWMDATGLSLPLPSGDEASWTHLLRVLGPRACLMQTPGGIDVINNEVLRAMLGALGRPVRDDEQVPLLLLTPVACVDLDSVLFALAGHPSFWVRHGAALLIGRSTHARAVPALLRLLDDSDNDVRRAAMVALQWQGSMEATEALMRRPWDEDPSVNGARIEALAAVVLAAGWDGLLPHAGSVPAGAGADVIHGAIAARDGQPGRLLHALRDGEEPLRHGAGAMLAALPEVAALAAESIAGVLRESPGVASQRGAVRALGAAGEDGVDWAADLLTSEDWQHRTCGAMALAAIGPAAAQADLVLVAALEDRDADVQREAALARLAAGCDREAMLRRVVRTCVRQNGFLERAVALGVPLGPLDALVHDARPSLELLGHVLRAPDERIQEVAVMWLGDQRGAELAPTFEAMARDEGRRWPLSLRRACSGAAMAAGLVPSTRGVVHRLLLAHELTGSTMGPSFAELRGRAGELACVLAHDSDAAMRIFALQLMRALGDEARPFHALIEWHARNDVDDGIRAQARAQVPLGWAPSDMGSAVAAVVVGDDEGSGGAALMALARRDSEVAVALALGFLDANERPLALAAATVVGHMATEKEAALWCVEAVGRLSDERWAVREASAALLGALNPAFLPPSLREEAAEALAVRGREDPDSDVQAAALKAARALEDV